MCNDFNRQAQKKQVAQQHPQGVRPRERSSPEQLQDPVCGSNLELIEIILKALKQEHDYL